MATTLDSLTPISEAHKRIIQQIVGTLHYYAQALEITILPYLNSLAEQQSCTTKNNESVIKNFLDYADTNPDVVVKFLSSDMLIHIDSDA